MVADVVLIASDSAARTASMIKTILITILIRDLVIGESLVIDEG